jgi:hypothetical protein
MYSLGSDPAEVRRIDDLASYVERQPLDLAALRERALAEGYGYVFVGAHGGPIDAAKLAYTPGFEEVYSNGRAHVFRITPDPL